MRLPADPRRRRFVAGGVLVLAVLAGLLIFVLTAGPDEDGPEQATGPTASPRPSSGIESPSSTAAPTQGSVAPRPPPSTSTPPAEAPQANLCGGTLQDAIDTAAPGAVLNLTTCTFDGTAKVDKSLTLIGGELTSPSENRLAITLQILADNVTIEGWTFTGGGNVISIFGKTNVRLSNNSFRDHTASPIMMWGGVRNIEISDNSIVHSKTLRASLIGGRGSEGSNPCPVTGRNVTIRNNYGDQGSGGERGTGWFGIELKCFEDVLIEGNTLKGGRALVSLPDSNRVTVRNNTLDLTGSAHWGVEIPKAHNVTIEHNTVFGDGPQKDTAFSANSGSVSMTIRYNKVSDVRTLVDDPLNSVVTDNCIINVKNISEYGNPESSQMERNAVC